MKKILHTTSWDDKRSQSSAFLDFINRIALEILRLNEGNQVHKALVNMPKIYLVKGVHCVGVGSSPIGATSKQVDG